jgi:hypothetical protein
MPLAGISGDVAGRHFAVHRAVTVGQFCVDRRVVDSRRARCRDATRRAHDAVVSTELRGSAAHRVQRLDRARGVAQTAAAQCRHDAVPDRENHRRRSNGDLETGKWAPDVASTHATRHRDWCARRPASAILTLALTTARLYACEWHTEGTVCWRASVQAGQCAAAKPAAGETTYQAVDVATSVMPCDSSQRSASIAALQPSAAAVTAWR